MGSITVRNLDDNVINALKAEAHANERSLEAEVRYVLTRRASRATRIGEFRERSYQISRIAPEGPQTDSVDMLREDRDR